MLRTVTFLCLCLVTTIALAFEKSGLSIVTAKGSQKFEVELAISPAQQSQGLMYRRDMPANAGMLFVYNRPQPLSFWMKNTFIPNVQNRGAKIIQARGLSSAASAASAAIDHVRNWTFGSSNNDWISMAIPSDGSYGISEGIIYSFPVICADGDYEIMLGLEMNKYSEDCLKISETELLEERKAVEHLL